MCVCLVPRTRTQARAASRLYSRHGPVKLHDPQTDLGAAHRPIIAGLLMGIM